MRLDKAIAISEMSRRKERDTQSIYCTHNNTTSAIHAHLYIISISIACPMVHNSLVLIKSVKLTDTRIQTETYSYVRIILILTVIFSISYHFRQMCIVITRSIPFQIDIVATSQHLSQQVVADSYILSYISNRYKALRELNYV